MASPINIQIVSDTSGATKGIGDVGDALGKAATELDKVDKQGQQTTENLLRDYQKQTQAITSESRKQVTVSKSATDERAQGSKESIREVGNEAKQNASETFSSFDGSAQSLIDGIQGTFGGVVGSSVH